MAKQKKVFSFSVVYEADPEGGYIVFAPSLPGCHTQGDTLEEAEKNIKEAISLCLQNLRRSRGRIPQSERVFQGRVEVFA